MFLPFTHREQKETDLLIDELSERRRKRNEGDKLTNWVTLLGPILSTLKVGLPSEKVE
jgi:hypothetical protein